MKAEHLHAINAARAAREAVAYVVPLAGGPGRIVKRGANDPLAEPLKALFATGKSRRLEGAAQDGGDLFARIYRPSPRLVIVGAVHAAQILAPMATACDFAVTIVDPREAFAAAERFAGTHIVAEWPDASVLALDPDTAVATLSHDPKIDDPALQTAIAAGCFYVGALGSRKTHAKRLERFAAAGFSEDDVARINAPIGLNIGSATPAEIAVSILAQVIEALRKGAR